MTCMRPPSCRKSTQSLPPADLPNFPTATVRLAPDLRHACSKRTSAPWNMCSLQGTCRGDNAVELMMESELVPGTVPFYYLCGEENYVRLTW